MKKEETKYVASEINKIGVVLKATQEENIKLKIELNNALDTIKQFVKRTLEPSPSQDSETVELTTEDQITFLTSKWIYPRSRDAYEEFKTDLRNLLESFPNSKQESCNNLQLTGDFALNNNVVITVHDCGCESPRGGECTCKPTIMPYTKQESCITSEELWESKSQRVGEDIDELQFYAGRDVLLKEDFIEILSKLSLKTD